MGDGVGSIVLPLFKKCVRMGLENPQSKTVPQQAFRSGAKGSTKNNLAELVPGFMLDLFDLKSQKLME
ncbi:MAG: hypothetical protein ISS63_08305 [Desulfobacteraceae bacterium]|nr:hypothetical protein [Desulfobacteraceae bacterium]